MSSGTRASLWGMSRQSHDAEAPVSEPRFEERPSLPYLAIRVAGAADEVNDAFDRGFPELFAWLGAHAVVPAGPPFANYLLYEPGGAFEVDLCVPVAGDVQGDASVRKDLLPAGRYTVVDHQGAYRATTPRWEGRDLIAAHDWFHAWGFRERIPWAGTSTEPGFVWEARIERYFTGPLDSPDPAQWTTELAFLVHDGDR